MRTRLLTYLQVAGLLLTVVPAAAAGQQYSKTMLPDKVIYRRLDSLVDVSLSGRPLNERLAALTAVETLGKGWFMAHPERSATPPVRIRYPGLVARMEKIFEQTDNASIRLFIVQDLAWQSERGEAVQFLVRVAEGPPGNPEEFHNLPEESVKSLVAMGPQGLAALRRLKASGAVKDVYALAYLEDLERHIADARAHGYRY